MIRAWGAAVGCGVFKIGAYVRAVLLVLLQEILPYDMINIIFALKIKGSKKMLCPGENRRLGPYALSAFVRDVPDQSALGHLVGLIEWALDNRVALPSH